MNENEIEWITIKIGPLETKQTNKLSERRLTEIDGKEKGIKL